MCIIVLIGLQRQKVLNFIQFDEILINIIVMYSLKSALGKDGDNEDLSVTRGTPSGKTFSKSKNGSMWTLDPDEEDEEEKIRDMTLKRSKEFELTIIGAYEKDSTFSEIIFFEIVEQLQGISEEIDELSRLQFAERVAEKMNQTSQQHFKDFLTSFLECLLRRIKKIKKKAKKAQLHEYEKIVKATFKKKSAQYIDEIDLEGKEPFTKPNSIVRNNAINGINNSQSIGQNSSSKRNGSASSTEGKLGKLISNGGFKEQKKQEQNEENQQHQSESISFSSMVSQSMAVRQRKPKEPKKENKEKEDKKVRKESEGESNGKDEAFIFYRPKAGKKS